MSACIASFRCYNLLKLLRISVYPLRFIIAMLLLACLTACAAKGPPAKVKLDDKKHDPYYMGVFHHGSMRLEVWKDLDRDLWLE